MPTTKYYVQWVQNLPSLAGKVVAITGTTSGTGYWTAVSAIRREAKAVILLNRESKRTIDARSNLESEKSNVSSRTELIDVACDLQSFDSVKSAGDRVNNLAKELGSLNVLANNAGIMAFPDERTKDGYDVQMQTNHLSHFLLTKTVLPSLLSTVAAGAEVRVVQQSSLARKLSRTPLKAEYFEKSAEQTLGGDGLGQKFERYHQTKLSNACFALALHSKLIEQGVDIAKFKSVLAEPGVSSTSLAGQFISESSALVQPFYRFFFWLQENFAGEQTAEDGALPLIQACFGDDVDSGDFFYPEKRRYGKPHKAISKGKLLEGNDREDQTLDGANHKLLWEKSEEVCGAFFKQ